ncbi:uncharacterized protein L969DRAFT_90199 [Mixia osmundae IAM 14324]|uniref:GRAM domain-containing protein n=1 Tax=Mixia osmundae (strain CBS 9802 / IAM 14324 / JCM 22182 / KY 12970) TaxID=764103 RepID=G7DSW7_MIXOS|nr:uncharacterized protein L969DRAFT_90199 [Mixia osmundae IAM 14324]KEI37133.1 hypothetical protein L969DRAFT_90199 [Mixia osmundae IAM 14324]GAA93677.1 hypothetical protein E5Q_00322 [Mixia osmundae IAM 14324]
MEPVEEASMRARCDGEDEELDEGDWVQLTPHGEKRDPLHNLARTRSEESDEEAAQILEELQDIEISEFLDRVGRTVTEVKLGHDAAAVPTPFPDLKEHTTPTGSTDYIGYARTYAFALADTYLPASFLSPPHREKFSLTRTRQLSERLYVVVPPSLARFVIEKKVARIYRWQSPTVTGTIAAIYTYLWYHNLIPAATLAFLVYQLLAIRMFPPSAEALRKEIAARRARGERAAQIGGEVHGRAAGGLATAIMQISKVPIQVGANAPTEPLSPSTEKTFEAATSSSAHNSSVGFYRMIADASHSFGPHAQVYLSDWADLAEKTKNVALWRRPTATYRTLSILCCCSLMLAFLPAGMQVKALFGWLGFHFFVLSYLQDAYPKYRRALNPLFWLLWDAPTDAECALDMLAERAGRPVFNRHDLKKLRAKKQKQEMQRPAQPRRMSALRQKLHRGSSGNDLPTLSRASTAASSASALTARPASIRTISATSLQPEARCFFALHKSTPGQLRLTSERLEFSPIKGLHGISTGILHVHERSQSTPDADLKKNRNVVELCLDDIASIKKEAGFTVGLWDAHGLCITTRQGEAIRFAKVSKRDECFNTLIASSHSTMRPVRRTDSA